METSKNNWMEGANGLTFRLGTGRIVFISPCPYLSTGAVYLISVSKAWHTFMCGFPDTTHRAVYDPPPLHSIILLFSDYIMRARICTLHGLMSIKILFGPLIFIWTKRLHIPPPHEVITELFMDIPRMPRATRLHFIICCFLCVSDGRLVISGMTRGICTNLIFNELLRNKQLHNGDTKPTQGATHPWNTVRVSSAVKCHGVFVHVLIPQPKSLPRVAQHAICTSGSLLGYSLSFDL